MFLVSTPFHIVDEKATDPSSLITDVPQFTEVPHLRVAAAEHRAQGDAGVHRALGHLLDLSAAGYNTSVRLPCRQPLLAQQHASQIKSQAAAAAVKPAHSCFCLQHPRWKEIDAAASTATPPTFLMFGQGPRVITGIARQGHPDACTVSFPFLTVVWALTAGASTATPMTFLMSGRNHPGDG